MTKKCVHPGNKEKWFQSARETKADGTVITLYDVVCGNCGAYLRQEERITLKDERKEGNGHHAEDQRP